ncbi:hypothetical protein FOXYSP1_11531 [Fusarium oxysporum f. sp. phaseoli]
MRARNVSHYTIPDVFDKASTFFWGLLRAGMSEQNFTNPPRSAGKPQLPLYHL